MFDFDDFGGDFFVSRPSASSSYTLRKCGEGAGRHSVGKPKGRGHFFVVGKPSARSARFLLGRTQDQACATLEGGVYVLQAPDGTFYVGKSCNIQERLKRHLEGTGATCAKGKCNRVPPLTPACDDLEAWERNEVLARMRRFGVGNVRGWMYTSKQLSDAQVEHAFFQVCEKFDLCRRCGLSGHFVAQCRAHGKNCRPKWAVL